MDNFSKFIYVFEQTIEIGMLDYECGSIGIQGSFQRISANYSVFCRENFYLVRIGGSVSTQDLNVMRMCVIRDDDLSSSGIPDGESGCFGHSGTAAIK